MESLLNMNHDLATQAQQAEENAAAATERSQAAAGSATCFGEQSEQTQTHAAGFQKQLQEDHAALKEERFGKEVLQKQVQEAQASLAEQRAQMESVKQQLQQAKDALNKERENAASLRKGLQKTQAEAQEACATIAVKREAARVANLQASSRS